MTSKLFKSRSLRDAEAKRLKAEGYKTYRTSTRNQLLHPQYVEDEAEYLREQTGFGNTVYKTHYAVLYEVGISQ